MIRALAKVRLNKVEDHPSNNNLIRSHKIHSRDKTNIKNHKTTGIITEDFKNRTSMEDLLSNRINFKTTILIKRVLLLTNNPKISMIPNKDIEINLLEAIRLKKYPKALVSSSSMFKRWPSFMIWTNTETNFKFLCTSSEKLFRFQIVCYCCSRKKNTFSNSISSKMNSIQFKEQSILKSMTKFKQ